MHRSPVSPTLWLTLATTFPLLTYALQSSPLTTSFSNTTGVASTYTSTSSATGDPGFPLLLWADWAPENSPSSTSLVDDVTTSALSVTLATTTTSLSTGSLGSVSSTSSAAPTSLAWPTTTSMLSVDPVTSTTSTPSTPSTPTSTATVSICPYAGRVLQSDVDPCVQYHYICGRTYDDASFRGLPNPKATAELCARRCDNVNANQGAGTCVGIVYNPASHVDNCRILRHLGTPVDDTQDVALLAIRDPNCGRVVDPTTVSDWPSTTTAAPWSTSSSGTTPLATSSESVMIGAPMTTLSITSAVGTASLWNYSSGALSHPSQSRGSWPTLWTTGPSNTTTAKTTTPASLDAMSTTRTGATSSALIWSSNVTSATTATTGPSWNTTVMNSSPSSTASWNTTSMTSSSFMVSATLTTSGAWLNSTSSTPATSTTTSNSCPVASGSAIFITVTNDPVQVTSTVTIPATITSYTTKWKTTKEWSTWTGTKTHWQTVTETQTEFYTITQPFGRWGRNHW